MSPMPEYAAVAWDENEARHDAALIDTAVQEAAEAAMQFKTERILRGGAAVNEQMHVRVVYEQLTGLTVAIIAPKELTDAEAEEFAVDYVSQLGPFDALFEKEE